MGREETRRPDMEEGDSTVTTSPTLSQAVLLCVPHSLGHCGRAKCIYLCIPYKALIVMAMTTGQRAGQSVPLGQH